MNTKITKLVQDLRECMPEYNNGDTSEILGYDREIVGQENYYKVPFCKYIRKEAVHGIMGLAGLSLAAYYLPITKTLENFAIQILHAAWDYKATLLVLYISYKIMLSLGLIPSRNA